VKSQADWGETFGADLTEREVRYLAEYEWARSAEDILWRRSKLGLRLSESEAGHLDAWMRTLMRTASTPAAMAGVAR
jgi:glycerol-3-phosphate dehydrogenase